MFSNLPPKVANNQKATNDQNNAPTNDQKKTKSGTIESKSFVIEETGTQNTRLGGTGTSSRVAQGVPLNKTSVTIGEGQEISELVTNTNREDSKISKQEMQIMKFSDDLKGSQKLQLQIQEENEAANVIELVSEESYDSFMTLSEGLDIIKFFDDEIANQKNEIELEKRNEGSLKQSTGNLLRQSLVENNSQRIKDVRQNMVDVPVPPRPYGGGTAKQLMERVDLQLPELFRLLQNDKTEQTKSDFATLGEAVSELRTAMQLMAKTPNNRLEMGFVADHMLIVQNSLTSLLQGDLGKALNNPLLAGVASDIRSLIDGLVVELRDAQDSLNEATGLNPISEKGIFHSKIFSTKGAITLLEDMLKIARNNPSKLESKEKPVKGEKPIVDQEKAVKVLENAIKFLKDRETQLEQRNSDAPVSMAQAKELIGSSKADHGIEGKSKVGKFKEALKEGIKDTIGLGSGATLGISVISKLLENMQLDGTKEMSPLPDSHPTIREEGILELFLDHALKEAGLKTPGDLRKQLLEHRYVALNSQKWEPISKEVQLYRNGQTHKFQSDIIPQSNLGRHFEDMEGGGVVCHRSSEFKHGTTVAVSNVKAPDGTTLFEGIRHGVINCYGINREFLKTASDKELRECVKVLLPDNLWKKENGNNSLEKTIEALRSTSLLTRSYRLQCARAMREEGSYRRAEDLVVSHLSKTPDRLDFALNKATKENPAVVNLNQIGLLTPAPPRGNILGRSGPSNEYKMVKEQMATLAKLSGAPQPKEIEIKTDEGVKKVWVKVNVNAFNFGVNAGAFGNGKDIQPLKVGGLVSGWPISDSYNKKAMNNLIGSSQDRKDGIKGQVGEFLNDKSIPKEKREIVKKLAEQVADLWDNKAHRDSGTEPYKMVSRLALLANMIGGDVSWNCKSGKDRTGQCDAEVKRLASEIYMTKDVPEPGVTDDETRANRFRMQVNGGNFEIQNYNTGAPGFKLGGVSALKTQINDNYNNWRYEFFRGIAQFYGS